MMYVCVHLIAITLDPSSGPPIFLIVPALCVESLRCTLAYP